MTIRSSINARELRSRLSDFSEVESAPEGLYEYERRVACMIDEAVREFHKNALALGLNAPNCDQLEEVAAVMFGYIADANPETVASGEGYGRNRSPEVDARLERDRDQLRALGLRA